MSVSQFLPAATFKSLRSPSLRMLGWGTSRARGLWWVALAALLLATFGVAQFADAQINVNTTIQGNSTQQDGTVLCSLQEAIYAAEFGQNIALDQTDPDDTYNTGCSDNSGVWNTIVLPGGTLSFDHFWDGDGHNPFGPTVTPIIFTNITIVGNGTTLQWTGKFYARLFAIGYASVTPSSGVVTGTTYSGTGSLTLQNVHVKSFVTKGGNGASGGGGGLGAGGAIYLGKNSSSAPALTVVNSTFDSNGAIGGDGAGSGGAGGGGGLGGYGGFGPSTGWTLIGFSGAGGGGGSRGTGGSGQSADPNSTTDCSQFACGTGGGGGGGTVDDGGNGNGPIGGASGLYNGGNGGDEGNDGHQGGPGGGGGGGGWTNTCGICDGSSWGNGGNGGYGGGGGGGNNGGQGGFGGGGGAAETSNGGDGGFGAGGGSGATGGKGGHFGGNATSSGGAGGGALGGAIFNDSGTVVIQNSTFYNNFVDRGSGGGLANNGDNAGGAIFSRNGSLTVQNATISNNQSTSDKGGVVVMNDGSTTLFTLDNTIIANNGLNGTDSASECDVIGTVTKSGAGNLVMSNGGCPGVVVSADPQLGPLQLNTSNPPNSGDTPTMAIQNGVSPAVDAGDDTTALSTDQRGVTRPQGPHSDIGAYEAPPPSADLSIVKAVSSATAVPGDTVTYTLAVSNVGPNDANTVTVTDALPTQLTFVSCSADAGGVCTFSGGTVSVAYATLANGASSTVMINTTLNTGVTDGLTVGNSASVSAASPTDPNTGNNSSTAYFTIHNRADLAVTKAVSSTSPYWPATGIEVGDSLTYTVTLTNKGPYDARGVSLTDSAPAGVTFIGCTASTGTCVWSVSSASLSLAAFPYGTGPITLTIQATLNFGVADGSTITNTASVTSSTFDPDLSNNSGSTSFTALNNSDLYIFQNVTKLTNRQLKYTVNVKNLGKFLAKQLLLTDPTPSGSYFVSITPGPWSCSAPPAGSKGTISCSLSTEAVGVTQTMIFVVKVTTPGNVLVNNTASVTEATFDPNAANNTSTLSTKVGP